MEILKIIGPGGIGAILGFLLGRYSKFLDYRAEDKREAAKRRPRFRLIKTGGATFRLINDGDADATGVEILRGEHPDFLWRDRPNKIDLRVGAAREFRLQELTQHFRPTVVDVVCDQFEDPAAVEVPAH